VLTTLHSESAVTELRNRGAAATAAELYGLARALLDRTVEYTKMRHQFDRPIASFQAVQHTLADVLLEIETGRRTSWVAMLAVDDGDPGASHAAAVAKALASDAARHMSDVALQFHGGVGYTWEHDLHMWLKRVHALSAAFGSASEHIEAIADRVLGSPGHDRRASAP
jgi:alkylation response protein AidB-like acyl-CoA dehydrogenase